MCPPTDAAPVLPQPQDSGHLVATTPWAAAPLGAQKLLLPSHHLLDIGVHHGSDPHCDEGLLSDPWSSSALKLLHEQKENPPRAEQGLATSPVVLLLVIQLQL